MKLTKQTDFSLRVLIYLSLQPKGHRFEITLKSNLLTTAFRFYFEL